MHSLSNKFLDQIVLTTADAAIFRTLGEYQGKQALFAKQRPETLEGLCTIAAIESTDASNRLEGIIAPEARLKALMQHSVTPRNRSEQEIAGYRDALNLIHQSATEMAFAPNLIRQLHQKIYSYIPRKGGDWKTVDNKIVEKDTSGNITRIRFEALSAVATPQAMEDLCRRYDDALSAGHDPIVVIPLTVLDFLCIHPFRDGNGRVSRLVTLLLLYRAHYEVGRYISLERIFEESKESYYETLEASSQGWHDGAHNVRPWLEYFWGTLLRAYREFEERVGAIDVGRGSKSKNVREAIKRKVQPFKITDLEKECPGISRETIRLVLRAMKSEGLVQSGGRGRGARWCLIEAAD